MLLRMNLDSTVWCVVGIWEQAGEHEGRWTMLKICVALSKEKGILFPHDFSIGIIKGKNQTPEKSCCYCKSQIKLCQEVGNAQNLRCIKQRKGSDKRNILNRCRQNAYSIAP